MKKQKSSPQKKSSPPTKPKKRVNSVKTKKITKLKEIPAENPLAPPKNETKEFEKLIEIIDSVRTDGKSFKEQLLKINKQMTHLSKSSHSNHHKPVDILNVIEDDLEKRHAFVKNMKHELVNTLGKLTDANKTIQSKDQEISRLNTIVMRLKRLTADQKNYLAGLEELEQHKDIEIEEFKSKIKSLNEIMDRDFEKHSKLQETFDLKDSDISYLKRSMKNLENTIKIKNEKITELQNEISKLTNSVKNHANSHSTKEGEIQDLTEEITFLKKNSARLESSAQEKNLEVTNRNKEIAELNKKIAELDKSIKNSKIIKEKDKEIAALKTDINWLRELNETFKAQKLIGVYKENGDEPPLNNPRKGIVSNTN